VVWEVVSKVGDSRGFDDGAVITVTAMWFTFGHSLRKYSPLGPADDVGPVCAGLPAEDVKDNHSREQYSGPT
jgi:hypothetical protein